MLTFDKLKIVAGISTIIVNDITPFTVIKEAGEIRCIEYRQKKPFLLTVKVDYQAKEVVVTFTGKILGRYYPQLISVDTIRMCFENINAMGFCTLDIDEMMNAEVVLADVTRDVHGLDTSEVTRFIQSHIRNYTQYKSRYMKNGNYEIQKNVTGKHLKKRLTIYDKEKEMKMAENRRFAEENGIQDAFVDTCRFELNLNSKEQIRKSLGLTNNKLVSVLQSSANPIMDYVEEVVCVPMEPIQYSDFKSYITSLVLKDCNNDLEAVEAKLRSLYSRGGFHLKRVMEPYRTMLEQQNNNTGAGTSVYRKLLENLA